MRAFGIAFSALIISTPSFASSGWNKTKNIADDIIYAGRSTTFYCGCQYQSHGDTDGSGDITSTTECGYVGPSTYSGRSGRVEWEHIVPASLMPAHQFECWAGPGGNRENCERTDPNAQAMLFDLHNLAPSIGQVNALRLNDRYADLPDDTSDFGSCPIEDSSGLFEPPDRLKGDVARVWLYMQQRHGVEIPPAELEMFTEWAAADPVSPWESEREKQIFDYSRVINPFVHGVQTDAAGACGWE